MRTILTATIIAVSALSLSACSGDSTADKAAESAKAVQSAAAAKTTEADGSYGARKELTKDACTVAGDGSWSFTGVLTNQQKTKQAYVVTASVVDGKTFTVFGRKEFKETLDAGKSTDLKADKFFTKKVDGAQCVIRVTRKAA